MHHSKSTEINSFFAKTLGKNPNPDFMEISHGGAKFNCFTWSGTGQIFDWAMTQKWWLEFVFQKLNKHIEIKAISGPPGYINDLSMINPYDFPVLLFDFLTR